MILEGLCAATGAATGDFFSRKDRVPGKIISATRGRRTPFSFSETAVLQARRLKIVHEQKVLSVSADGFSKSYNVGQLLANEWKCARNDATLELALELRLQLVHS